MNNSLNFYQEVENFFDYKNEMIAIARMNYPVGTIFRNPVDNCTYEIKENHYKWYSYDQIDADKTPGVIFHQKKWAEIISTPKKEFHKDDYIVTLNGDFGGTACAKKDYCFKQRNKAIVINPCIDLDYSRTNANTTLKFDCSGKLDYWRYATKEEIRHYNTIEEPFDVKTLSTFQSYDPNVEHNLGSKFPNVVTDFKDPQSIFVPKIITPKKVIKPIIIQNFILHI